MKQKIKNTANRAAQYAKTHKKTLTIAAGATLALAFLFYVLLRTTLPLMPNYVQSDVKVDQPLTVTLGQFIQPIKPSDVTISPAVEGSWSFVQTTIGAGAKLVFTPKTYFREHTTYTVHVQNIKRIYGNDATIPDVKFTTEKAPSLSATDGIASWRDGQVVAADSVFAAKLAAPNRNLRTLELRTSPEIPATLSASGDQTFTWKPDSLLPENIDMVVEIYDTKNAESLVKRTVHVAPDPRLTSSLQRGSVDEHDKISLTFDQPIDQSSAKISFDLGGNGTWENETTYVFTPEKLAPNTTYHYTITSGLRSKSGGLTRSDIVGEFTTFGPVAVVGTSPRGNGLSQGSQTLSFTFDRPVDHASAQQRLSVSSGQITGFSWAGNTLRATVANLGFQQRFSATIAPGVANTSFGSPSNQPFSLSFTTEVRSVRLSVPYFAQQHSATCTAASLRMVLAYRGVGSDEIGLVNAMGYAPRAMDKRTNPPTWDDSGQMFVGSIDGSITAGTGAGPDAPPIAKAARAYGRSASPFTGVNAGWIAQQIHNGNPVIMFGAYRATGTTTWKTPSGGTIVMNLTGHATVVTGVQGEPSAPLGFWVNDPLRGSSYWSAAAVEANIARDPDRQAVVVY